MAIGSSGSSPWTSLLPKEHGAYVQLSVALTAGLVLGHGNPRAWGQAILTVLVFLASEPLLTLLGLRGSSPQPAVKARAMRWLALLGILALPLAYSVWWQATFAHRQALILPVLLASVLMGLALAKREHTTLGELVAAWALSSSAYPVAILGGAGTQEAGLLLLALAGIQSIGTTTVRAFLASLKRRGQPLPRAIPLLLGGILIGAAFASRQSFSWVIALGLVPNTSVALWMFWTPPSPRHMKRVGWILTLASVLGLLPVLIALR